MPRKYSHIQEHEKEILELRSQGMTLREIGEKLGISRSYVSRIEKKALEKLRHRMADFGIMW